MSSAQKEISRLRRASGYGKDALSHSTGHFKAELKPVIGMHYRPPTGASCTVPNCRVTHEVQSKMTMRQKKNSEDARQAAKGIRVCPIARRRTLMPRLARASTQSSLHLYLTFLPSPSPSPLSSSFSSGRRECSTDLIRFFFVDDGMTVLILRREAVMRSLLGSKQKQDLSPCCQDPGQRRRQGQTCAILSRDFCMPGGLEKPTEADATEIGPAMTRFCRIRLARTM